MKRKPRTWTEWRLLPSHGTLFYRAYLDRSSAIRERREEFNIDLPKIIKVRVTEIVSTKRKAKR